MERSPRALFTQNWQICVPQHACATGLYILSEFTSSFYISIRPLLRLHTMYLYSSTPRGKILPVYICMPPLISLPESIHGKSYISGYNCDQMSTQKVYHSCLSEFLFFANKNCLSRALFSDNALKS